ncbi:hypothetical protein Vadar_006810 [Vaccinium darrowii]|uniref:Uncharacterized protein n=1 Tax=Vaccinium darrowii TaxID=229202 RepID=A0ACB7ZIM4_9ERIC|nr:hypothetical protein Vadar_006810 [Vaccinium darrowii]
MFRYRYYITSRLTEKSDVYSFGVVLLELITGQPAIVKSEENTHIVQWVKPSIERGEISSIADPRLQGDFDSNSVWKMFETAIACVRSSPIQRPTASQVLGELNECLEIYLASRGPLEIDEVNKMESSSRKDNLCDPLVLESSMSGPQASEILVQRERTRLHAVQTQTTGSSCILTVDLVEADNEGASFESKAGKETIDFKEVKRIDHILASLQRKLPPAPPPPPFPEGYAPLPIAEVENSSEAQQGTESQLPPVDPIIDQGPPKRMKV